MPRPGHDDPLPDEAHRGDDDPARVASQLEQAAEAVAAAYDAVPGDAWDRPDRSSTLGLGRRHLPEVEHHAWEVRDSVRALTVRAHDANLLDPAGPSSGAEPHDGAWADASLLHVARADLPVVLRRLAAAVGPDGVLSLSVERGEGSGWSTHGSVAAPRRFTSWPPAGLAAVVTASGWAEVDVERAPSAAASSPTSHTCPIRHAERHLVGRAAVPRDVVYSDKDKRVT